MDYEHIAGVDKPVSRLIQGTVYFTDQNPAEAYAIFDTAFEHGCNAFDTAHAYQKGASETILGQWIRDRQIRDSIVIIDKGAHPYDGRNRVTPQDITSDIHESLERLGVETIDLYLLHRDDLSQPVGPIMECLYEHHQAGRITAIGGSNWTVKRMQEANTYARNNGLLPFVFSSPQFSLAEMVKPTWDGCISAGHDGDAQTWYQQESMALLTWSSLAGGFMTGRYTRTNLDNFSDYFDRVTIDAYAYEANFVRLARTRELADKHGATVSQLALAYVLNQPLKILAITGSKTPEQFLENVRASDISLTQTEMDWLDLKTNTAG